MSKITILEFGGKFEVDIDNNVSNIMELKNYIVNNKNGAYHYDNLKIIYRGSEIDDSTILNELDVKILTLIIVPIKCDEHTIEK